MLLRSAAGREIRRRRKNILSLRIGCRVCLKTDNTPKQRTFFRQALPIFLAIHPVFCNGHSDFAMALVGRLRRQLERPLAA